MKEIPDGFVKMNLVLNFPNKNVKKFEDIVLFFLVRDYYLFYTKKESNGYTELHFWCQPDKEGSLTYLMGCYCQKAFNYFKGKDYFVRHGGHRVVKPFPESYHIDNSVLKECEKEKSFVEK